jgi:putative ABC transport system ATP-binding protein
VTVGLANTEALLLRDVGFRWPDGGFTLSVPALSVARGERVLLLGASGSGKSTLLSMICGINAPDKGEVIVDGTDIGAMRPAARDRFRAERIGVIFQMFNLLPHASALDNILLPLRFAPDRRGRAGAARDAALALTRALGLPDSVVVRGTAGALSVGQQQRVAVARALIGSPPLIVADEPTSALDAGAQGAFLDLMFAQLAAAGANLLMVSHDDRIGARFDRVLDLSDIAQVTRTGAAA